MSSLVISKEAVSRILRDVKEILKTPLTSHGIHYSHDESNLLKGQALIIGSAGTPYIHGAYFFTFEFPVDYPHAPPIVTYCTNDGITRFNPNFYKCGKVCLSVLNTWRGEQWTGCQTLSSILLVLCTTLNETPILNEPGITKHHYDYANYHTIIQYKNYEIAIHYMLNSYILLSPFAQFYSIMRDYFLQHYEQIHGQVTELAQRIPGKVLHTDLYTMTAVIDYEGLKEKIEQLYNKIEINKSLV